MVNNVCNDKAPVPVALAAKIGQVLGLEFGESLIIEQHRVRIHKDLAEYGQLVKEN
jgi:hypothetical protein